MTIGWTYFGSSWWSTSLTDSHRCQATFRYPRKTGVGPVLHTICVLSTSNRQAHWLRMLGILLRGCQPGPWTVALSAMIGAVRRGIQWSRFYTHLLWALNQPSSYLLRDSSQSLRLSASLTGWPHTPYHACLWERASVLALALLKSLSFTRTGMCDFLFFYAIPRFQYDDYYGMLYVRLIRSLGCTMYYLLPQWSIIGQLLARSLDWIAFGCFSIFLTRMGLSTIIYTVFFLLICSHQWEEKRR